MNAPLPGRMPGLDVLRGLACLAVFAVHSIHSPYAESGWVAMQVFFVLSGYLITCSLLAEERRARSRPAQLRRFFAKRALRILPALLIFMAVMVPLTRSFDNGSDAGWAQALLFVHNFYVMSAAHELTFYFNNFWSLSVEEQFYLSYPWLFVFCPRRRTVVLLLALLAAPTFRWLLGSLATQEPQWFTTMQGEAEGASPRDIVVYVSTFSHIDAFSLGGLLALHGKTVLDWFAKGWRLLLLSAAVVAIGGLVTGSVDGLLYRAFMGQAGSGQHIWGYTALNLWACGMVGYFRALQRQGVFARSMNWLGRISYEFYMVHFPVIALCVTYLVPRYTLAPWAWVALQLLGSIVAAYLLNLAARWLTRWIEERLPLGEPPLRRIAAPVHPAAQTR